LAGEHPCWLLAASRAFFQFISASELSCFYQTCAQGEVQGQGQAEEDSLKKEEEEEEDDDDIELPPGCVCRMHGLAQAYKSHWLNNACKCHGLRCRACISRFVA